MTIPLVITGIILITLITEWSLWLCFRTTVKGIDFERMGNSKIFTKARIGIVVIIHAVLLTALLCTLVLIAW